MTDTYTVAIQRSHRDCFCLCFYGYTLADFLRTTLDFPPLLRCFQIINNFYYLLTYIGTYFT